ncbi:MAG: biotin-independent malonate decarboxylase subunit beta [Qingshengfaniella sp.]
MSIAAPFRQSLLELTARDRIAALVDPGSFAEILPPSDRVRSPHLAMLDLPAAFDDGVIIGEATLDGRPVMIAAQEGRFMGGAVGEVHGAKLAGLFLRAAEHRPEAVIFLPDSGGVRLHEANAGLIAVGELQRAILTARDAGVPTIAAIGSANGCFGGVAIATRCCDWIVMSAEGRLSVSGPEVIETARGVEEFDATDRPLVWRTMGGRHRLLIGEADHLVEDDTAAFRAALVDLLGQSRPLDLDAMLVEHAELAARLRDFGDAPDARDIWKRLGAPDAVRLPDLSHEDFLVTMRGPGA